MHKVASAIFNWLCIFIYIRTFTRFVFLLNLMISLCDLMVTFIGHPLLQLVSHLPAFSQQFSSSSSLIILSHLLEFILTSKAQQYILAATNLVAEECVPHPQAWGVRPGWRWPAQPARPQSQTSRCIQSSPACLAF